MKHRFDLYVRYTVEIDLPNPITTLEGLHGPSDTRKDEYSLDGWTRKGN